MFKFSLRGSHHVHPPDRDVSAPLKGLPINSPEDAERSSAQALRSIGFSSVEVAAIGPDGGIDVLADDWLACQVKAKTSPVGRPDLQRIYGAASAEDLSAAFFSLGGYAAPAIAWAETVSMPLFRLKYDGQVEPVNGHARHLSPTDKPKFGPPVSLRLHNVDVGAEPLIAELLATLAPGAGKSADQWAKDLSTVGIAGINLSEMPELTARNIAGELIMRGATVSAYSTAADAVTLSLESRGNGDYLADVLADYFEADDATIQMVLEALGGPGQSVSLDVLLTEFLPEIETQLQSGGVRYSIG